MNDVGNKSVTVPLMYVQTALMYVLRVLSEQEVNVCDVYWMKFEIFI